MILPSVSVAALRAVRGGSGGVYEEKEMYLSRTSFLFCAAVWNMAQEKAIPYSSHVSSETLLHQHYFGARAKDTQYARQRLNREQCLISKGVSVHSCHF